jgi:hypothetical protein
MHNTLIATKTELESDPHAPKYVVLNTEMPSAEKQCYIGRNKINAICVWRI